MKNIHILPTDKPSRLAYYQESTSYNKPILQLINTKSSDYKYQHIYITNDEKIKDGDWSITLPIKEWTKPIKRSIENSYDLDKNSKKIILTTDQDFIKDGIQAIDDEFLEWIIKNPSCEEIDVDLLKRGIYDEYKYKIIIPKEEPKQRLEKYSERFNNDKSPIGNSETWGRRIVDETLEEVAEIFVNNRFTKQICGDEFYPDILASKSSIIESHILFAKWQQERSYSEEEVLRIIENCKQYLAFGDEFNEKKWFEQFKKK